MVLQSYALKTFLRNINDIKVDEKVVTPMDNFADIVT